MHQEIRPRALLQTGSTVSTQDPPTSSGGDGVTAVRLHDVGPTARPLPAAENDTPSVAPPSHWVQAQAGHLPTAVLCPGPEEDRVPECGSDHPTATPAVRGGRCKATARATTETTDAWGAGGRGGRGQGVPRVPGVELVGVPERRLQGLRGYTWLYGQQEVYLRSPEIVVDGSCEGAGGRALA